MVPEIVSSQAGKHASSPDRRWPMYQAGAVLETLEFVDWVFWFLTVPK